MARQREFDEDKVLTALQDVFWEHGYEGTSYRNIMAASGLQKGSLYAAFGDKRALYQKALARYDSETVSSGIKMLRDDTLSGHVRIKKLFQSTIDATGTKRGRWGCLLCNAAIDQAPHDPETEKNVKASMARLRSALAYALKNTKNPDGADAVLASYFGARVLVKAGMSKTTLQKVSQSVLNSL